MPKRAYYAARAIAERRRAQAATDPRVASVHAELSARYEALSSDPSLDLSDSEAADSDVANSGLESAEQPASETTALWNPAS